MTEAETMEKDAQGDYETLMQDSERDKHGVGTGGVAAILFLF